MENPSFSILLRSRGTGHDLLNHFHSAKCVGTCWDIRESCELKQCCPVDASVMMDSSGQRSPAPDPPIIVSANDELDISFSSFKCKFLLI